MRAGLALLAAAILFTACARREAGKVAGQFVEARLRGRPAEAEGLRCEADRAKARVPGKETREFETLFFPLMRFTIEKIKVDGDRADVTLLLEGPDPKAALKELLAIDMASSEGDADFEAIQKLVAKIHEGKGFPTAQFRSQLPLVREGGAWRVCLQGRPFGLGVRLTP